MYKDVVIDLENFQSLPKNDISKFDEKVAYRNVNSSEEDLVLYDDSIFGNYHKILESISSSTEQEEEIDKTVKFCPSNQNVLEMDLGGKPCNKLLTNGLVTMVFPTLFPEVTFEQNKGKGSIIKCSRNFVDSKTNDQVWGFQKIMNGSIDLSVILNFVIRHIMPFIENEY